MDFDNSTHVNNSLSVITITNLKKRKLDEYDNNNDRKKRKLSKSDANNELNKLKEQNNNLIKERDHYKNGYEIYKKELNKWRSQYINLYSQICGIANNKPIPMNDNINISKVNKHNNKNINTNKNESEINKNELSPSPTPPPKKYFHKPMHKRKHNKTPKKKSKCVSKKKRKNKNNNTKTINTHSNGKYVYKPHNNKSNNMLNDANTMNQNNNSNEKYDSIKNRLLQMGYNKTDVINRISLYNGSGKSPEFVFNQLIHTFTGDTTSKPAQDNWKDNYNKKNDAPPLALVPLSPMPEPSDSDNENNNINYNSQYIDFENSYYVSINCHICKKKHFTDIFKYKDHIKNHYTNDTNKTWKTCDLGCNLQTHEEMKFIRHIATHTGNYPFKCNIKTHGNKCNVTKAYKSDMKTHWKSHFKITDNNNKKQKQSDYDDSSISEMDIEHDSKYIEFEHSYNVSIRCYICKKHFINMDNYKIHIKNHYINDANKIWGKCNFECKSNRYKHKADNQTFINHIHTHTKARPYVCNVLVNGIKCGMTYRRKYLMKTHWMRHFKRLKKNKLKFETDSENDNYEPEEQSDIDYNNGKCVSNFENSYHISVKCHVCKKHFKDFDKYKQHLHNHYTNDPHKIWQKCDLGCKDNCLKSSMDKPFKCDVMVNGIKCELEFAAKLEIKQHYLSHMNESIPIKRNWHRRIPIKKNDNNNIEYVKLEDSFYISIHCHICKKYFDDIDEYKYHLQKHYKNDPNTTWRKCNLGCKIDPKKPLFSSDNMFISHIAQHTNEKPFKCNVMINGKKCQSQFGGQRSAKKHWKTHFNQDKQYEINKQYKPHKNNYISFENSYYVSVKCHICTKHFKEFDEYKAHLFKHYKNDPTKKWKYCDFKCTKKSFGDSEIFIHHILSHTKTKPFICDVLINGIKCGVSCSRKCAMKTHYQSHFKKNKILSNGMYKHIKPKTLKIKVEKNKNKKRYKYKKKYYSDSESESDSESSSCSSSSGSYSSSYSSSDYSTSSSSWSESDSESSSESDDNRKRKRYRGKKKKNVIKKEKDNIDYKGFDENWSFSINCHVCKKQINRFGEYRIHMKRHFDDNNTNKRFASKHWLQCDFGCVKDNKPVVSRQFGNFIAHTSMHTNQRPFQCDIDDDEEKCKYRARTKAQLKKHWRSVHFEKKI